MVEKTYNLINVFNYLHLVAIFKDHLILTFQFLNCKQFGNLPVVNSVEIKGTQFQSVVRFD